ALTTRFTGLPPNNLSSAPPPPRWKCTFRSRIEINGFPSTVLMKLVRPLTRHKLHAQSGTTNNGPHSTARTAETRDDKSPAPFHTAAQRDSPVSGALRPAATPESDTASPVPPLDRAPISAVP